jgi:uncharacterized protein YqjF (DUF2071 family)
MRPRIGGNLAAMMFRPIATHDFLNVRTYVQHGEPGIHFLAEWLSSRLAVMLGPTVFGLPYRHGKIRYEHDWHEPEIHGSVIDAGGRGRLVYTAESNGSREFLPCTAGSRAEWLMERYTAFNSAGGWKRFFRVWHSPWPQQEMNVTLNDMSLLTNRWPWFHEARFVGANFSPGFDTVWMSRPHRVKT